MSPRRGRLLMMVMQIIAIALLVVGLALLILGQMVRPVGPQRH